MNNIQKYLEDYKNYLQLSCSGSTIVQYSGIVAKYLLKVQCPYKSTYSQVLQFINSYNSNATQKQVQGAVMHFHKGVVYRPELTVRLPKIKTHQAVVEILTENETHRLLESVKNIKHKSILSLIYYGGLRISEVINLQIKDIDGEKQNENIHIRFSKGAKSRIVPITEGLLQLLRKYFIIYSKSKKYNKEGYLFQGQNADQYSPQSIRNVLKKHLKLIGVSKQITPHSLRHSRATHLLENGVCIKKLKDFLGHTKTETTERYTHLSKKSLRNSIIAADTLISLNN